MLPEARYGSRRGGGRVGEPRCFRAKEAPRIRAPEDIWLAPAGEGLGVKGGESGDVVSGGMCGQVCATGGCCQRLCGRDIVPPGCGLRTRVSLGKYISKTWHGPGAHNLKEQLSLPCGFYDVST